MRRRGHYSYEDTMKMLKDIPLDEGWNYWYEGKEEKAFSYWMKIASSDSDIENDTKINAYLGLALYYVSKGDKDKIEKYLELIKDTDPKLGEGELCPPSHIILGTLKTVDDKEGLTV